VSTQTASAKTLGTSSGAAYKVRMSKGDLQSFYDFFSVPAAALRGGYFPASDTEDPGWFVWAYYTAQLGNGFSATLATEQGRDTRS